MVVVVVLVVVHGLPNSGTISVVGVVNSRVCVSAGGVFSTVPASMAKL